MNGPDIIPATRRRSRTYRWDRRAFVINVEVNAERIVCAAALPEVSGQIFFATAALDRLRFVPNLLTVELWFASSFITLTLAEFQQVNRAVLDLSGAPIAPHA